MIAYRIAIIGPDMPEIYDLIAFFIGIIHHFAERFLEGNLEAGKDIFKSNHGEFGLEKIGAIEAIQAISPKGPLLSHQNLIFFAIIDIELQIFFHLRHFLNRNV